MDVDTHDSSDDDILMAVGMAGASNLNTMVLAAGRNLLDIMEAEDTACSPGDAFVLLIVYGKPKSPKNDVFFHHFLSGIFA